MDLLLHLELIRQRQLISNEIIEITLRVQHRLHVHWHADLSTNQINMGLIHLAMALGRIRRGYCARPLDRDIFEEIKSTLCFGDILAIHQDILSLIPFDIPDSEQTHLIANWYSLALAQPQILSPIANKSEEPE
ncbi:hypothetical protein EDC45_1119 [Mesocricetibacter intestinalis]|uniref:PRD domain-containing protein n=1 Tax=Mesocricetibacter intestinalis TaxID=1521930 RepID=A0A4R6V973_9PAST|nr:hypothetical protein [Mesocricetibacter intestinalis]TDQ58050.1 hypothetical protein EDC45_1119 [Mesocricetibacter intestinalis]